MLCRLTIASLLSCLVTLVGVLLSVGFLTVVERKYLSGLQRRRGPNIVGLYGLVQVFSDGLKLSTKEFVLPSGSS